MDIGNLIAIACVGALVGIVLFALWMERRERKRHGLLLRQSKLEREIADGIRRGRIQTCPRGERR